MDKIWISIDGGGTKTQICACGADGECIYNEVFASANYKTAADSVGKMFREAFEHLLRTLHAKREQIAGILCSASGCDTLQDRLVFEQILKDCGFSEEIFYVCNDTEAVYFSNCREPGICVVAGTGSIACAFDDEGMIARSGGWGAPLSDLGSGYWIGAKILERMILYLDGMETSCSPVYERLWKRFYKEGEALPWTLSLLSVTETASAARDVLDCAEEGDPLCRTVRSEAAEQIAALIRSVVRKAGLTGEVPVLAVGGLMRDEAFLELVRMKTEAGTEDIRYDFCRPKENPAVDALDFARKRFSFK